MMVRITQRLIVIFSAISLLLAFGCGGETAITTNTGENRIADNEYEPPDTLDDTNQLLHVSPCDPASTSCARTLSVGDTIPLEVQLLDSDGDPIQDAMVSFDLDIISGGEGISLDALRDLTNSDGIATVNLRTREDDPVANMGTASVTAYLEDFDIEELDFNIGVSTKDAASYVIQYTHDGDSSPGTVRTLMVDSDISCRDAVNDFLDTRQWPPSELPISTSTVHPNGDISQVIYPQVGNNERFTIIGVARQEIGSQQVDVAYGCEDEAPAVEMGVDVNILIPLTDHIPHIGGTYDVTHKFNLVGALPPIVQTIVDLISTLANDPAHFILGCPEENSICPDGGQYGIVDMLLEFDFLGDSISSQIESFREGALFGIAIDYLNGVLYGDPNDPDDTGILPDWAHTGIVAAGDITDMLQEFTVQGRMFFDEQPDVDLEDGQVVGLLYEANNKQVWDSLVFQWSYGCEGQGESCSNVPISASNVGSGAGNVIDGNFGAKILGSRSIQIEEHSLSLHYGALILAAIEEIVIPSIFGANVTSIDEMMEEIISCNALAGAVADEDSSFGQTIENLCGELLNNATDALRSYITDSFVAEGDNNFKIRTPVDAPCTINQPDNYIGNNWPGHPLPYIESLGQDDAGMRCEWSTDIRFTQDSDPINVGGTFFGDLL